MARRDTLLEVLGEGRNRGLIGRRDLADQILHAAGFVGGLPLTGRLLDLGSGNGLPGLVIACINEDVTLTLLDSAARRCRFLEWGVAELGLGERVVVVHGRAESAAREAVHRGRYDAVVSRSFGPAAVAAECARGFLDEGGVMVVSDPPEGPARWDATGLAHLGFRIERSYRVVGGAYTVLRAEGGCPDGVPRRVGMPAKRPLF